MSQYLINDLKGDDRYRFIKFVFAVFILLGLIVVGIEGWRNGVRISTLTIRAIIVVIAIRIVGTIIIGVLRSYEEIQGG